MSKLKDSYLVVKQNNLNEFRPKGMTWQELRFFVVYLSKINPKDEKTRVVRFSMTDFQKIVKLERPSISKFKKVIEGLLTKVVSVPLDDGMAIFQFFKECIIKRDEDGLWYLEFDCHDRTLPLMFDLKNRYFKYELWNTLHLKSVNQLRMYEILKQHEKNGYKIISVEDLKELLGIEKTEYPRFNTFKSDVLEVCKKALTENTDISYTYEPYGKKGRGGKILQIKFNIIKNKEYKDPIDLKKLIEMNNQKTLEGEQWEEVDYYPTNLTLNSKINLKDIDENGLIRSTGTLPSYEERIDYLMTACNNEFSREEMVLLYSIMQRKVPNIHSNEHKSHDYLQHKYREMEMNNKKSKIIHRFAYFRSLVEKGEG